MTRALVWKEIREQWAVFLALLFAAVAGVAGMYVLLSSQTNRAELSVGILWFAGWGYGLVCGALLLAGEAEDGTQVFLDILPVTRRRLWQVKAATGLTLLAAQLVAFLGIGFAITREGYLPSRLVGDVIGLLTLAVVGYAWGLYCGSFASNVLSAIAWGVLLQTISGLVLIPLVVLPLEGALLRYYAVPMSGIWLGAVSAVALTVAVRSQRVYCAQDRLRESAAAVPGTAPVQRGWEVLFWLAWCQVRWFAIGMVLFAVFATVLVASFRLVAWPVLTLFIGILCGVTTFADEQQSGAFRFPGDQRFPLGRFWLVKIGVRFAAGLAATAVIALGVAAIIGAQAATNGRQNAEVFENTLRFGATSALFTQPVLFLVLWLIYGYAVGLPSGLLFRKPLVGSVVAVAAAYPLAAIWAPSFFASAGLHAWQVWGVPVLLLIATRVLMHSWATDRLLTIRSVRVALVTCVASALWLGAALWYRVAEIPVASDPIDVDAFIASLPKVEENIAGRLSASALRRLTEFERVFDTTEPVSRLRPPPAVGERPPAVPTFATYLGRAGDVAERGWGDDDGRLGFFLDRVFRDVWAGELAKAANERPGIVVDARNVNSSTLLVDTIPAPKAATLLVARGLQQQHHGDPATFVDELRAGLALSRNLRHSTVIRSVRASEAVESQMLRGVERWLEKLDGRPSELKAALKLLRRQADEPASDLEKVREAEFLVSVNDFTDPRNLLVGPDRVSSSVFGPVDGLELLRFSWQVPWEKIRLRRLLEGLASHDATVAQFDGERSPPLMNLSVRPGFKAQFFKTPHPTPLQQCTTRATLLQVALRLYQAENGKPAERLEDLVPRYLSSVPTDPYDGKPFRYRLSRGEHLDWPPADLSGEAPTDPIRIVRADQHDASPTRAVPAGQGILWSVGEDLKDDGGKTQVSPHHPGAVLNEDVIFLVPLEPARP